jgi:hypothetical protein
MTADRWACAGLVLWKKSSIRLSFGLVSGAGAAGVVATAVVVVAIAAVIVSSEGLKGVAFTKRN